MIDLTENRAGRIRWLLFLSIWFAAILICGIIFCRVMVMYGEVYEKTKPEDTMEELMNTMSPSDWFDKALPTAGEYVSVFDDGELLFTKYYSDNFAQPELTYRKLEAESGSERAVFIISSSGIDLYKAFLTTKADSVYMFGRHDWILSEVKVCDYTKHLESTSVVVYQNSPGQVIINSNLVDARYYVESVPFEDSNPLELQFDDVPLVGKYVIDKIYGSISVTELTGIKTGMDGSKSYIEKEIFPEYDEKNNTYCYHRSYKLYSVEVFAPEDVSIYISGVKMTDEYSTEAIYDIFSGYEDYTGIKSWKMKKYTADSFHEPPEITAFDADGNKLEATELSNGKLFYFHNNDKLLELELKQPAKKFFDAYFKYFSTTSNYQLQRNLMSLVYQRSELYDRINKSSTAMISAPKTSTSFSNLEFGNFERFGQDCFFCTVTFDGSFKANMTNYASEFEYCACYELLFVRNNGKWLAAGMSRIA